MDTCLAALQLMVYYRYLPSLRSSDLLAAEALRRDDQADDITIEFRR